VVDLSTPGSTPHEANGSSQALIVTVPGGQGRSTADLYAQPRRGAKVHLGTTHLVDGQAQSWDVSYDFPRRSVITVVFHGDAGFLPATKATTFTLKPSVALLAFNHYSQVQDKTVWRFNHKRDPELQGQLLPVPRGPKVRLVIQKLIKGKWKAFHTQVLRVEDYSDTGLKPFPGRHPKGSVFRFRVVWAGNLDFAASTSQWRTIRFT
jgi:hypothetical protein